MQTNELRAALFPDEERLSTTRGRVARVGLFCV